MPNNFTVGGITYDLDVPAQLNACMVDMANTIHGQATTIGNLQAAPALNQVQFQQMIQTLTPAGQRQQGIPNPVLSQPGQPAVNYQEVVPTPGMEDIKGYPAPTPFTGEQEDAIPFLGRLKSYFAAKPRALRFTKFKILYACPFMMHQKSKAWASLVKKSITDEQLTPYYYDNWDAFEREFLRRYGLTNPKQHYFRKMITYRQFNNQDCKNYTDEFNRLREQAETDKPTAFHYLKTGTYAPFRTRLIFRENPPADYDAWIAALTKIQEQVDEVRENNRVEKPGYFKHGQSHQSQPAAPQMPKGYGDPMDVDALRMRKGKQVPPRKVVPKSQFPRKVTRLPPHPTASSSASKPTPFGVKKDPKKFRCFICDQTGHFARDCKTSINQIDEEHVRQMGMALEATLDFRSQEEDNDDEDEADDLEEIFGQFEEEDDAQTNDDLISFESQDQANNESGF